MATFIQLIGDDGDFMVVESETAPIHDNQFRYDGDKSLLRGAMFNAETNRFYKEKRVPDLTQPTTEILNIEKVSG